MIPARLGNISEIDTKLSVMRRWLNQYGASALRLRGTDWFAWATAGGSSAVLLTAETGVAEILITMNRAFVLTDEIEIQRIKDEEVPPGWEFHVNPWAKPVLREQFVENAAGSGLILSDRPGSREQLLPSAAQHERMVLGGQEQQRYRALGRLAAAAMTEAMRAAKPEWSEYQLAGAGAAALWRRGVQPALVLAAGEPRLRRYRHATPSAAPIGQHAMMVFCGRRHGLYANLTRFVTFDAAPLQQHEIMAVEAAALAVCRPGNPLSAVYRALDEAYCALRVPAVIHEHHQGGITGYLARELVATPDTALVLKSGMALAFNPSFSGIKMEDTFLLSEHGLENLTLDPEWPTALVRDRARPLWLEAP